MKSTLFIALANGHVEAAHILANKRAECTGAEIRQLGNRYILFSQQRAALQAQRQGEAHPAIQAQKQGEAHPAAQEQVRPEQEQDSIGKEENRTGEKQETSKEQEIREKGGFVFQIGESPKRGEERR